MAAATLSPGCGCRGAMDRGGSQGVAGVARVLQGARGDGLAVSAGTIHGGHQVAADSHAGRARIDGPNQLATSSRGPDRWAGEAGLARPTLGRDVRSRAEEAGQVVQRPPVKPCDHARPCTAPEAADPRPRSPWRAHRVDAEPRAGRRARRRWHRSRPALAGVLIGGPRSTRPNTAPRASRTEASCAPQGLDAGSTKQPGRLPHSSTDGDRRQPDRLDGRHAASCRSVRAQARRSPPGRLVDHATGNPRAEPPPGPQPWQCLVLLPLPQGHGSLRPAAAITEWNSDGARPARSRSDMIRIGPSTWWKNS